MKGYKGFYPGLICEPDNEHKKQYAENTVYEEDKAKCCRSGMHFCKYPLDVFNYYAPSTKRGLSEYAEVEALDEPVTDDESKHCSKKLKIGAKIGIPALVQASVEYIKNNIVETKKESATGDQSAATNTGDRSAATNTGDRSAATNTGNYSAATNTGYWSAATNTGYCSAATNTGYCSAATNTGDRSAATNTGNYSAATNTGYWSAATNTGYCSAATNTGYCSAATNTGDRSAATNTGDQSAATNTGYQSAATNTGDQSAATNTGYQSAASVEGKDSIALAFGVESKAKGTLGCYIVLAEWGEDDEGNRQLKTVKCHKVDGKTVKPGTWYMLKNGKFTEVK